MKQIFAVYDKATAAYMDPFTMVSKGQAIRAFTDLVNENGHPVNQHPEDYHLFHLGEYNPQDGLMSTDIPNPVIGALEVVAHPEAPELRVASDG